MKADAGFLATLLLVALPAAGYTHDGPPPLAERSEQVVDARGLAGLDVENSRGRVTVGPSADGRIHVIATRIARMAEPADAHRYLAQTRVESGVRGTRFVVEVRYPHRIETAFRFSDLFTARGRHRLSVPSLEVVIELAVPPGLPLNVKTASGDVVASDLAAPVQVNVTSGDVDLRGLRGVANVECMSGQVTLEGVAGARVRTTSGDVTARGTFGLDCRTMSGDIGVDGAREALVLSTESGDVDVTDAPAGIQARSSSGAIAVRSAGGTVRLVSSSGDIRAGLRRTLRGAEILSGSGGVSARLATGMGAQLAATTTSGSMDCNAGPAVLRHGAHSLEGRIGSGGPAIRIQTVSGDLTVTSGGD